MGLLERQSFAQGWVPDADAVNGPANGLLRMDNCVLDELGIVSLRAGSATINGSPLADLDVHSLFTTVLSGTRQRMVGAGSSVYANGSSIVSGMTGSGDVAFGSHLGQILFARGSSTKKYDGASVRHWGISNGGAAPTIGSTTTDGKVMATCDSGEAPPFVINEDDGTGLTYATGQDGTANGAIIINPDTDTGRGTLTKTFAASTDFTAYDAGGVGTDNDLLQFYVYVTAPEQLLSVKIMVDVNSGSTNAFQDDYYQWEFATDDAASISPTSHAPIPPKLETQFEGGSILRARLDDNLTDVVNNPVFTLRTDKPIVNAGWSKLAVRRGDMQRVGSTFGKDWKTVKAVRLVVQTIAATPIQFDSIKFVANPLSGRYKWCYVLAYNSGAYVGKSAPSPLSAEFQIQAGGAVVTIPAASRDGANELWLFRFGGVMDGFYRVAVATSPSAGSFTINDAALSDIDVMTINVKLEADNATPPDNIIGIAGPYFDRVFCLTSSGYLYPSRRLNPDSFSTGQAIRVTGADETPLWIRRGFGGLYIGTSKDIYTLEGDGSEQPDGSVNFIKREQNVDHPPINDAVVASGSLLIYFAEDGWRAMTGSGSQSLTGMTSLFYRGQTRHGRGPVNTMTGRFRAAISKGQLVTMFPENTETTSTARVARQAPAHDAGWYYHVYPQAFRTIYREPDGTLLAGDTAGYVWQLDTGTTDGGTKIPIVIWTKIDDDNQAFKRKDPWDLRARLDTGGDTVTIAIHQDGSSSPAGTVPATLTGESIATGSLEGYAACQQIQLRMTGTLAMFRLYSFAVAYRDHPLLAFFMEPKPVTPSATRRRFSGLNIIIDTLSGDASVLAILDNAGLVRFTVNTDTAEARSLTFPTVIGRDLWANIGKPSGGFELYEITPRVIEELPPVVQGRLPQIAGGSHGVKTLSGIELKVCTLGAYRTFTVYLDGVAATQTFTIATGAYEPDEVTLAFTTAQTGRLIALEVDGDVELYAPWAPIISSRQPLGVRTWDSGPIDLGSPELTWLRRLDVKVNAGADLVVKAYMDGALVTTQTIPVHPVNVDTIVAVDFPRGTKGRQARLVFTSAASFFPYWIRVRERVTTSVTDKKQPKIPVTLGGVS